MDAYKIYRQVLCIDLKGFFASVECALRGLDPYKTPLIVADKSRGGGSIVLAVTPYLKKRGMKSRFRLHELGEWDNLIIAKPRMNAYLKASKAIVKIYLQYVAFEDLHIYSIDEAFLDVTAYLTYYKKNAREIADMILNDILKQTHLPAACGIGDNMLLSKLALDLYSKKSPDNIAEMRYSDVETMLWPVRPLSKMWGIGSRMEKRLNQLNIYDVGSLARTNVNALKKRFGIIGEELYYHAYGIDMSVISEKDETRPGMKSVGLGQTLFKDYDHTMIMQVLLEMTDTVAEKLRFVHKRSKTIHLGIGYSKQYGGGFSRQLSFDHPSADVDALFAGVLELFLTHAENLPIRRVFIRAGNLVPETACYQLGLFDPVLEQIKRRKLWDAIDQVRARYGKKRAVRLSSYLESGTMIERTDLVGGHHG